MYMHIDIKIETGTLWECTFFYLFKDISKTLSQRSRILYKHNHESCTTCKCANTKQRYSVCPVPVFKINWPTSLES